MSLRVVPRKRDPEDLTGHCQDGNHHKCEDYPDTSCLCVCHDKWGIPDKYKAIGREKKNIVHNKEGRL